MRAEAPEKAAFDPAGRTVVEPPPVIVGRLHDDRMPAAPPSTLLDAALRGVAIALLLLLALVLGRDRPRLRLRVPVWH